MPTRNLEQIYVEIPINSRPKPPAPIRLLTRVAGTLMSPVYVWAAARKNTPGIEFHRAASRLSRHWLIANAKPEVRRWLFNLVGNPIVLTRYQEFDFAWRHLPQPVHRYLDVSSPSIFPLRVMAENQHAEGILINPDPNDLALTQKLVEAGGLQSHCRTASVVIEQLDEPDRSFDLITSLSVIEHIPDNKSAIHKIWQLLKSGGVFILTLPCAARAYELHTNIDQFGQLGKDEHGRVFMEYLYDEKLLEELIFSITGRPQSAEVYGEIQAGFLRNELVKRWAGNYTPFWKEPLMMGKAFKRFTNVADLPGEGVIGLKFVKS